jgi:DNA primase
MVESKKPWVDVNEIKRVISLEKVLANYGVLDKMAGRGGNLRGLSPFRKETTPSFFVNLDGNKWNDMAGRPVVEGKEVPGNVVGLVMAFENCSFRDALLKLHEMAGLSPGTPPASAVPTATVVTAATHAKVEQTLADPAPPAANEPFGKELKGLRCDVPFLAERGLSSERARYWGVGYCSRGLFKSRIVVPIRNRSGDIVAYIGRSLKNDDPEGKWRFPKGFHKSLELFGVDRLARDPETREAAAKYGIIVVEGCFDAIHLSETGFKNTIATLGSVVSPQQRALLVDAELNPSKRVTIFFDNDDAGKTGRKKLAADLIYDSFVRYVDFGRVPGDRTDPDEYDKEELARLLG